MITNQAIWIFEMISIIILGCDFLTATGDDKNA